MRFGLAITALVLSGIFLILGIGQRTFLAGPDEITYSTSIAGSTGYAVIPGEAFIAEPGQPNVVVTGVGAFAATGVEIDVAAWVEPFDHSEIAVDRDTAQLRVAEVRGVSATETDADPADSGTEPAANDTAETRLEWLDPRGSDLWLAEEAVVASNEEGAADVTDAAEAAADPASSEQSDPAADSGEAVGTAKPGTVRLPVGIDEGDAVLVSVAEGEEAEVSLVWVQDQRTPLAGPFLAAGALLAAVGVVLYLLAVDHDRRGLGPRRGRSGPLLGIRDALARRHGPRGASADEGSAASADPAASPETAAPENPAAIPADSTEETPSETGAAGASRDMRQLSPFRRFGLPALGLALALGLSGCSAEYWPDFGAQTEAEAETTAGSDTAIAPVPVTRGQIDRIVRDVAAVAGAADDALDAALLTSRFTGDALEQRTANYTVRKAVPDYAVVPPRITDEALGYELVQSTQDWPRTIFVTVASESAADPAEPAEPAEDGAQPTEAAASPSLALILTQASPQENFLVSRVISLRGGITMPEAAPAEEGTALLSDDLETLALAPGEVGTAYAAVLTGGSDVEQAKLFDLTEDTLIERSGAAWAAQSQATADAAGQGVVYSVTAAPSGSKIISLSTGVGGALVATTILEDRIEEPGSSRWKPTPPASVTALSGLSGQQDRLVSEVQHQLLFFVPSKTSNAPIQLLGFTSDLVGARN